MWIIVVIALTVMLGAVLYSLWELIETVNVMYYKLKAIHDYTILK